MLLCLSLVPKSPTWDIYEKFPWRGAFLATEDGIYNLINKIRNVNCRVSIKTGLVVWPYPSICP